MTSFDDVHEPLLPCSLALRKRLTPKPSSKCTVPQEVRASQAGDAAEVFRNKLFC
jgi:hypothetical protein